MKPVKCLLTIVNTTFYSLHLKGKCILYTGKLQSAFLLIIVENQYIIINIMFLLTEFWVNYICFNNSIDGGGRKYGDG